ncbi:Vacuolar protein sorting-associated protein 45-like protein [Hibiscus syriacus]|uniref:Vacuolar protein sorting-associated protein 45-like protein n=1 Tax=Hibiscus syriacus TaxID=106335 RepID=A0A6A3BRT4_HIBSY|nr:Vacuolar protein sorting-associated protein 45-like protein [Hibiscus syriacus]
MLVTHRRGDVCGCHRGSRASGGFNGEVAWHWRQRRLGRVPRAVTNLLNNESISDIDRLRLFMLEIGYNLLPIVEQLVQFLLKQAELDKRTGDLYGNRDFLNIARNMARGLEGVENVYTQHRPAERCGLPIRWKSFSAGQEVVIFIVGGTTYEESRSVAQLNASSSGIRFLLGGTVVLNSKRFLKDLEEAQRSSNKRQCCVSPNIG